MSIVWTSLQSCSVTLSNPCLVQGLAKHDLLIVAWNPGSQPALDSHSFIIFLHTYPCSTMLQQLSMLEYLWWLLNMASLWVFPSLQTRHPPWGCPSSFWLRQLPACGDCEVSISNQKPPREVPVPTGEYRKCATLWETHGKPLRTGG